MQDGDNLEKAERETSTEETLVCPKEKVEDNVAEAHGNASRDIPLEHCPFQLQAHCLIPPFNMADFTLRK